MPRLSRYQVMQHAAPKIKALFKSKGNKVYSEYDIREIFSDNRFLWLLPHVTRVDDFIKFLIEKNIIKYHEIKMPNKIINRYSTGNIENYDIAQSISEKAYICHYTAIFIHGLTENIPKNIYINIEQKPKITRNSQVLTQENIDRAFSRPMRKTNQIGLLHDSEIYVLNGKNVNNVGVIDLKVQEKNLRITNIERTLIDIIVRPSYAGGVNEVLEAYKMAKNKCSINKLIAILKTLDYTYPYHQAIGFYLERAGYPQSSIKLLEKLDIKYNFYLTYQIGQKDFSERWKLFFPRGF